MLGRDVFVGLPRLAASGKSLCYAALPFMFNILSARVTGRFCSGPAIYNGGSRKYKVRGLQAAFVAACKPLVVKLSHWKELQDAGYASYQPEHHKQCK